MHKDRGCLTEFDLGAYMDGKLAIDRREVVEQKLAECPDCLRELIALRRLTGRHDNDTEDIPERAIIRAAALYGEGRSPFDVVISLMKETLRVIKSSPSLQLSYPAPAFELRNSKAVSARMAVITKTFEKMNAEIDIEQIEAELCNIKVTVVPTTAGFQSQGIRIELISGERELASYFVEHGFVLFEEIGKGSYSLRIRKKDHLFGAVTLSLE